MKLIDRSTVLNEFVYSDLELLFKIHPSTHDLTINKDLSAVYKSIRNLLLTAHYERPFHPEIGSNLRRFLFENPDAATFALMEREISDVLNNFEPRIQLVQIEVFRDATNDMIVANIQFYLSNKTEINVIQLPLGRNYTIT